MRIGGFIKQSLIDYPGNIASVVFTKGCNFRCGYCHNPELVLPQKIKQQPDIPVAEVLNYIEKYAHLLDAIVITGGEPTMQAELEHFIAHIKQFDINVKLDTNGSNPGTIERLLNKNLLDFIAMDIKAPLKLASYQAIVGKAFDENNMDSVKKTAALIIRTGVDHEFRTTVVKDLLTETDLEKILVELSPKTKSIVFQQFIPNKPLNPQLSDYKSFSENEIKQIVSKMKLENQVVIR